MTEQECKELLEEIQEGAELRLLLLNDRLDDAELMERLYIERIQRCGTVEGPYRYMAARHG